jgi:hypothetical protein
MTALMFLFVLHFSVMKAFHLLYHSAKNLKTLPGGPKPSPTPIKDPCGWSFLLRSSMEKEVYIYILSHLLRKPTTLWEDPKPPHPLPTKPDRHPGRYPLLPRCPGKKKFHLVSHTPNKPTALPEDVNSGKDLSGLPLLLQSFTARVLRLLSPAFHARHKPITLWEPPTPPPPPPPRRPSKTLTATAYYPFSNHSSRKQNSTFTTSLTPLITQQPSRRTLSLQPLRQHQSATPGALQRPPDSEISRALGRPAISQQRSVHVPPRCRSHRSSSSCQRHTRPQI